MKTQLLPDFALYAVAAAALVLAYWLFRRWQDTSEPGEALTLEEALDGCRSSQGMTLREHSEKSPVLVVFLRHFGCTFCREALADLAAERERLEADGARLAFVHMASLEQGRAYLSKYGLDDVPHFSDPACGLYRAFSLGRATFGQAFGWKSWLRGVYAGVVKGQGVGKLVGDGFRMPGAFLVSEGRVRKSFRHRTVADVPDYLDLAACPLPERA